MKHRYELGRKFGLR